MTVKNLILLAALALLTVACGQSGSSDSTRQLTQTIDSLQRLNHQKDQEINDMLSTMNDIEEGFRQISEAQGRVTVARQGEGSNNAARIREDVQFIQQTMSQNADLIAQLRSRLNASSIKSEQLRKAVEALTAQLQEKNDELQQLRQELERRDIHIAELDQQVAVLSEDVSTLRDEKRQQQETINAQDQQLHAAWYVFGTKKELKQNNILKNGEVLQDDFDKGYFTEIDIRYENIIQLHSRDARILTTHPKGSYALERDDKKQYVLHITNPTQFWSTSRYLVVQVK